MSRVIVMEPMSQSAFAAFGEVIEAAGEADAIINRGLCARYHDRASLDFARGRAGISLFKAEPRALPLTLEAMERHPDGSQAFIPMSMDAFLVIAAEDEGGKPGRPRAFGTSPGQAVNFRKGAWHGALAPLAAPGLFAVVDRIGEGPNLEEHWFDAPYTVEPAAEPASAGLA